MAIPVLYIANFVIFTGTEKNHLTCESLLNFRKITGTILYRSARPDKMSKSDVQKFLTLGIKTIIDLRSAFINEYEKADGQKYIDDVYEIFKLKSDQQRVGFYYQQCNKKGHPFAKGKLVKTISNIPKAHVLIDVNPNWKSIFKQLPLLYKVVIVLYYILDKIFGGHLVQKLIAQQYLNQLGLIGLYKNIIDTCGHQICTGRSNLNKIIFHPPPLLPYPRTKTIQVHSFVVLEIQSDVRAHLRSSLLVKGYRNVCVRNHLIFCNFIATKFLQWRILCYGY